MFKNKKLLRKIFPSLFIVTLIFSTVYCTNPFTTRANKVEDPEISGNVYTYDSAENIINNFQTVLNDLDNASEYINCFAPENSGKTFTFIEEPFFYEEFNITGWTINEEQAFYQNLKQEIESLNFYFADDYSSFEPITGVDISDSLQTQFVTYQMTVNYNNLDSSKVFTGKLRFKLFKESSTQNWYIYYWQDQAIGDNYDACFTALKSEYL